MKKVWAWIRKWWWVVLGGLAAIVAWLFARKGDGKPQGGLSGSGNGRSGQSISQSNREFIEERVERAEQDAKIEKLKRDKEVDKQRDKLEEIEKEPDTRKRREKLSEFLTNNL